MLGDMGTLGDHDGFEHAMNTLSKKSAASGLLSPLRK